MEGDKEGIDLWNKLGTSTNPETQAYFRMIFNSAQQFNRTYFTDAEEQRKKRLNNQKIYYMYSDNGKWNVQLFHYPLKQ